MQNKTKQKQQRQQQQEKTTCFCSSFLNCTFFVIAAFRLVFSFFTFFFLPIFCRWKPICKILSQSKSTAGSNSISMQKFCNRPIMYIYVHVVVHASDLNPYKHTHTHTYTHMNHAWGNISVIIQNQHMFINTCMSTTAHAQTI